MRKLRSEKEIMSSWNSDYSTPLVSISCITYNHEQYIEDALEGFLIQETTFPFEILIHDDASIDKTADIIREYESEYPKMIKPIYQKVNQYSQGKRPTQFISPLRKGKYIAYCEGDDYWITPHKLQRQVDYMEANNNCGMCIHAAYKVNGRNKRTGIINPYKRSQDVSIEDVIRKTGGFMATNSRIVRKKYVECIPELYRSCKVGDYPSQIYFATIGKIYYINDFLSCYRVRSKGSWSESMLLDVKKNISHWNETISFLERYNEYTEYKYSNSVEDAIKMRKIHLNFSKGIKFKDIPAELNESLKKMSIKQKLKLILKYRFPGIIRMFISFKRMLDF